MTRKHRAVKGKLCPTCKRRSKRERPCQFCPRGKK